MIKKKKALVAEELPEYMSTIDSMPAENKIFVDKSIEIAEYVFRIMEMKGMKQKELAEKMGKTEAEISKILGGMQNLTIRSIAKLEAALEETIITTPITSDVHLPAGIYFGASNCIATMGSIISAGVFPEFEYKEEAKVIHMHTDKRNAGMKLEAI